MSFIKGAKDGKHYWLTPPKLMEDLNAEFNFEGENMTHKKKKKETKTTVFRTEEEFIADIKKLKIQLCRAEIRIKRGEHAAFHALLEMTAWMGMPEHKRMSQIKYLMENVTYCLNTDIDDSTLGKK